MNVKVVIPTCKKVNDIALLVFQMESRWSRELDIIYTCLDASAACNRNAGLKQCNVGDIVIMVDDDIDKLPLCWDRFMWEPFEKNPGRFSMVSARLLNKDGTIQPVMGGFATHQVGWVEVKVMPSAMIAFEHTGIMFNEKYKGSGWEDTSFCRRIKNAYPDKMFIINNDIRVVHNNEMKNQSGEIWVQNRLTYIEEFGSEDF